ETGFDPGLHLQAALYGFFGKQAGAEHQGWIRSVGAACDGSYYHGAAGKIEGVAIVADLDVFLWRAFDNFGEGRFGVAQRDAILRALGSGDGGLDGAEIELELVAEKGISSGIGPEQRLFLAVGFHERDLFVRAAGELEVGKRLGIDGEKTHGRAIFGSHVGDSGAIGNAEGRETG